MVLYSCDVCNFKSQYLTRYREHCQTRKHLRNVEKHEKNNICCEITDTKTDSIQEVSNTILDTIQKVSNKNLENQEKLENNHSENICKYCNKSFRYKNNYYRHIKHRCKKRKENDKIKILESQLPLVTNGSQNITNNINNNTNITNNITTNNTNNNNNINININNLKSFMSIPSCVKNIDKTIKFLNDEYPDVLDFPSFIIKVRDECVLSEKYRESLIVTFKESPFHSFMKTFNCVLTKMCIEIGIVPFCCSDSNLRNHKEKHTIGWCNMIDTTNLRILVDVVLEKVNKDEFHICLFEKQYVHLCNKLKSFFSVNRMKKTSSLPASMDYNKLLVGV